MFLARLPCTPLLVKRFCASKHYFLDRQFCNAAISQLDCETRKEMLTRLLDRLLRCSHSDYSFPITLKSDPISSGNLKGTYVVCLDCGQE